MAKYVALSAAAAAVMSISLPSALAQWSTDPGVNLVLADRAGEQVQPKIKPTADGGAYVSWYDNSTGGYDVYLQRLNASGVEQWAHDGLLIADRAVSSTVDYDLIVDTAGNAVITYNDDGGVGGTPQQIAVQRVSPAGALLWGPDGVTISAGTAFKAAPKVAQLSDGSFVVAYTDSSVTPGGWTMQKLDGNGAPQWAGTGFTINEPGRYTALSDLEPGDNGSFILLWVRGSNTNATTSSKYLLTQKYDGAGAAVWTPTVVGAPLGPVPGVVVYMPAPGSTYTTASGTGTYNATLGGSIQNGYFPTMLADGAGGAVYGWYENAGPRNAYIQHVLANGTLKFAQNGVSNAFTALNPGRIRVGAAVAYDPTVSDYFLASTESSNPSMGNYSAFVQRFDTTGTRQWSDTGVTIIAPNANQSSFLQCHSAGPGTGDCLVFGFDARSATTAIVFGARVDDDETEPSGGVLAWANEPCTIIDAKSRMTSAMSTLGFAMLTFGNTPAGSVNIHAQNVNPDGTLGVGPTITAQPQPQSACIGASVAFTLAAEGSPTLMYQWRGGGVEITGATAATLTIPAAAAADAGSYDAVVTNARGQVTTAPALLTICAADFNCAGGVTVQDIFDFLAAYFGNDPAADINGVGGVTVQDIFDFLAAYFTGCA